MSLNYFPLAQDSMFSFPWYTWVSAIALVVVLIAYKMYQKKMMG
jgi:hypothetical protein